MSKINPNYTPAPLTISPSKSASRYTMIQRAKQIALTGVVAGTFAIYALHERSTDTVSTALINKAQPSTVNLSSLSSASQQQTTGNSNNTTSSASQIQSVVPTATTAQQNSGAYRDGQYVGPVTDAYYGNVQVQVTIQSGKIADVQFLDFPQDRRTSRMINSQATPWLTSEALQAQSARVDIISGATLTSEAFIQSLQTALDQAKNQL